MIARPKKETNGHSADPKPGPIHCALYTRKSVDKGADEALTSVEAQRRMIEQHIAAKTNGWMILPELYDDSGVTGAHLDRPAFQRLMAAIDAGQVQAVGVYMLDRVSRSLADLVRLLEHFRNRGVQIISVREDFGVGGHLGDLMLHILGSVAEYQRRQTQVRVRDKILETRKLGHWTGGAVPLGYRSVEKRLVIDERAAQTVRDIVAVYLETGSLTGTLDVLRQRGVVAKTGAPFTVATLGKLLHSPIVGGRIRAGDELVRAQHEAILDKPTWDALQAKLAKPEKPVPRHRRTRSEALLANLVRCGRCGAAMSSHWTGKANGRRYPAYVCQSIIRMGAKACPGSRVPAPEFEASVVEQVRGIGRDPDVLHAAVVAAGTELVAERNALTARVARLKADAQRLRDEQAHLVDAVSQGGGAARELVERLNALRPELEAADAALKKARADLGALKRRTIDADELLRAIASFDGVWQHLFPAERQRILGLLIERIVVTPRDGAAKVDVTYSTEGARTLLAESKRAES